MGDNAKAAKKAEFKICRLELAEERLPSLKVWNAVSAVVGIEGATERNASQETDSKRKKNTRGAIIMDSIFNCLEAIQVQEDYRVNRSPGLNFCEPS
jgi:hypothetical protein